MVSSFTGISDHLQSIWGDKGQRDRDSKRDSWVFGEIMGRDSILESWYTQISLSLLTGISDHLQSIWGDKGQRDRDSNRES